MSTKFCEVESDSVKVFREYLRIPSVQPNINYDDCVRFLKEQGACLDLPVTVHMIRPSKPIVVVSWLGTEPSLKSLLLNSHMDVVPVFRENWTYDPFGAEKDANGNIYARGSQDMKCVGIQYLEAVKRLKRQGIKLRRTIHMSFVPDEEIGGETGMRPWVNTTGFTDLNVGCALDEGMASPDEQFQIYNGERCIWQMHIHCPGTPGHGSLLLPNTAGEKVRIVLDRFMERRQLEKDRLEGNGHLAIGDVTTINLTRIMGGVQSNVVPPEMIIVFDCRLTVDVNHKEFEEWAKAVCKEAGDDVWIEFEQKAPRVPVTKLDASNPWWVAFKAQTDKLGLKLKTGIFPGGTDSRYVRQLGIPAIGFSPMNNTPVLLHDHDEFLNEKVFLRGIDIYCSLLEALGNI